MDRVARTGETLTITKNGKPVAELRPHRPPRAKSLIGLNKGQIEITGDIVSPTGAELWQPTNDCCRGNTLSNDKTRGNSQSQRNPWRAAEGGAYSGAPLYTVGHRGQP